MDERDLTKLSYLTQALVIAPDRAADLIKLVGKPTGRPACLAIGNTTAELQRAITALCRAFEGYIAPSKPNPKLQENALKTVARSLLASTEEPSVDAGMSLSWAIENRFAWRLAQ